MAFATSLLDIIGVVIVAGKLEALHRHLKKGGCKPLQAYMPCPSAPMRMPEAIPAVVDKTNAHFASQRPVLLQETYSAYQAHFEKSPVSVLRDCLELTPAGPAIPIEEVQPAEDIMTRFCTGGMSLGAISRETHETIAVAMNRIGGANPDLPV